MAKHDVAIVGAGMVGVTLACGCADLGLKVVLIDANVLQSAWQERDHDLRVSAITLASERIFQAIGVWSSICAKRVSPFTQMHVWDAQGKGKIHFDGAQINASHLGHIIENGVIQSSLLEHLSDFSNVTLVSAAKPIEVLGDESEIVVKLDSGKALSARLLVGADGTDSKVRALAGIGVVRADYAQRALVARVQTELDHKATARQRFLSTGPLAFLPLLENKSSIVWSTTPQEAARLLGLDDAQFCVELTEAFEGCLGQVLAAEERASFPLRLLHAQSYIANRVALMGDAAHTMHPLAGQGANMGLLDAAAMVDVIARAQAQGRDIGSHSVLRRYERWRKGHNLVTMGIMDGFKRGFGAQQSPMVWARNLGLTLFDRSDFLKNTIMSYAAGMRGDLPSLAQLL